MSDHAQQLQRVRDGDIASLESLLQNHQRSLFRLAYSLLLDAFNARQAVQEGLLSAIYTPGKYDPNEPFEIWLGSLVVRSAHTHLAKGLPANQTFQPGANLEQPSADTELWSAYLKLNAEHQIPMALRYFHGYTVDQVARLMRVGHNTVRSRLGAGRSRLLELLNAVPPAAKEETNAAAASIGHDQARFLLQSAQDEPLSAQEWVPLQSHLDHCEACRGYRRRLQTLERDIQRTLRAHLDAPTEFKPLDPEKLLARQRAGLRARSMLLSAGKALGTIVTLGIGLFLAYIMFIPSTEPVDLQATMTAEAWGGISTTPTVAVTATPPIEIPFRTPLVFESSRDGNAEIYLLDPDGQSFNLTRNPAADTEPIWSPDGEWVAFLSDRSGKNEIYLLHVSGTRLVQVTDEPGVEWEGAVSWSGSGQRLAITGRWTEDENRTWIYLINLASSNEVVRVSFSRDANHPRWAPNGNILAYERRVDSTVQLFTRRVDSGEVIAITDPHPDDDQIFTTPELGFDWSPTSEGLVFAANGPYTRRSFTNTPTIQSNTASQLRTSTFSPIMGFTGNASLAWTAPSGTFVHSTSWSPANLLAFLQDDPSICPEEGQSGIGLTLRPTTTILNSSSEPPEPLLVPGVCASAYLTDSSWSPDGRWLVLKANTENDTLPALYALDVIKAQADLEKDPAAPLPLVRLTEPSDLDRAPQVRPQAAQLGIDPDPVRPTAQRDPLPPVSLVNAPGEVVFTAIENGNSEIFAIRPDGTGRTNLSQNLNDDTFLAVLKEDPGFIAFFSSRTSSNRGPEEVFVMGPDGASPTQITNIPTDPRPYVPLSYGTFSFSPDGARLTAEVFTQNGSYLAVFPTTPGPDSGEATYIPLQGDVYTQPLWIGSEQSIYFASSRGYALGLIKINPDAAAQSLVSGVEALRMDWPDSNWGRITDMEYLPDTQQFAFLATRQLARDQETTIGLFVSNMRGEEAKQITSITIPNEEYRAINAEMNWLAQTRQLLVHISTPVDQKIKSIFLLIDAGSGFSTQLWQTEDYAYHQDISPDGRWLLYNTETGLWALNIEETLAAKSGPARVTDDFSVQFAWRP